MSKIYKCPSCKSKNVGQMGYINMNTNEGLDTFEPTSFPEHCYQCDDCFEYHDYEKLIQEEDGSGGDGSNKKNKEREL